MKKRLKIFIILIVLSIFYLYVANITLLPKTITLLQGEKLELATVLGVNLKKINSSINNENSKYLDKTLETSSIINDNNISSIRKN